MLRSRGSCARVRHMEHCLRSCATPLFSNSFDALVCLLMLLTLLLPTLHTGCTTPMFVGARVCFVACYCVRMCLVCQHRAMTSLRCLRFVLCICVSDISHKINSRASFVVVICCRRPSIHIFCATLLLSLCLSRTTCVSGLGAWRSAVLLPFLSQYHILPGQSVVVRLFMLLASCDCVTPSSV